MAGSVCHATRLHRGGHWLNPGPAADGAPRLQASEKVVLGHHFYLLALVLEGEHLGSFSGGDHAWGQDGRVNVAEDKNVGAFGDAGLGGAADRDHVVPRHLPGPRHERSSEYDNSPIKGVVWVGVRVRVSPDEPMPSSATLRAGGVVAGLHVPDTDMEGVGQVWQRVDALLPGHGHGNQRRAASVRDGFVMLTGVYTALGRDERQPVRRQAIGAAGERHRAQKVDRWPRDFICDAGVPDHAHVKSSVVTHQGLGAGVADDPFERPPPAWRTCHHLGVDAVQPGVESVEMVKSGWWVDQRAGLIYDVAVAYFHHANRTW